MTSKQASPESCGEILLNPPRGTRDFIPHEMLKQNWLLDKWRKVSEAYGYKEYSSSALENVDLWLKKNGEEIYDQMYTFEKDGQKLALRPEMTPTLARMLCKCIKSESLPIKWYSIPRCWRYETTTRGRAREFFQWNVDIIGGASIKSEVDIFLLCVRFFKSIDLTSDDVSICISSRGLLQSILNKLQISKEFYGQVFACIDKFTKMKPDDVRIALQTEAKMTDDQNDKLFEFIKAKTFDELRTILGDDPEITNLERVLRICSDLGIGDWLELDMTIVRGLSYYTGIVFEGFFKNSEMKRAVMGGGRYDNLLALYGGDSISAIGIGMGDIVILDVLAEKGLLPQFTLCVDYMVAAYNADLWIAAQCIAEKMRNKNPNLRIETYQGSELKSTRKNMGKLFAHGDKIGAVCVVLVAPDEQKDNKIVVKDLRTTDKSTNQETVDIDEFIGRL